MNDRIKEFLLSLLSRKFLLAVIASLTAYSVAIQDNTVSQPELWAVITPILTFIGVEGGADITSRITNIPKIEDQPSGKSSKKS